MAKLLGIKKYVPRSNVVTKTIRMAENYIKTHTDEYGEVSNPEVYNTATEILAPFSDDLKAANKIADYKNKSLKLTNKIEKAENSRTMFDFKLQEAVIKATQENISDPRGLMFKLTSIYGAALDEFDENILGKAVDSLPKGQKVPQAILNYRDKLSEKSKMLVNLSNSYLTTDPETELAGPTNADAYGFMVQTNPQTGAIVNLDIQEITSLEKPPSGYVKSNARFGRVPIYLNTYYKDNKEVGKLGGISFDRDVETLETGSSVKILKGKWGEEEGGEGFWAGLSRAIGAVGAETKKGLLQEQQEFPLNSVPFDYFDIPKESVVKDGKGSYYYYDKDMLLWRAESSDILKRYLREIGKEPNDVDNKFYFGHSDFISQMSQSDEGKERVIDEDFFKVSSFDSVSSGQIKGDVSVPVNKPTFRFNFPIGKTRTTTPTFLTGREFTPEGYKTKQVIQKGEEIFKGG